jgi:hypothetical protein
MEKCYQNGEKESRKIHNCRAFFSCILAHFFAALPQKNRAIRSNLLAAPKGFPLLSLVPRGLPGALSSGR